MGFVRRTSSASSITASFETDPKRWLKLRWMDVHSRRTFSVTTNDDDRPYDPDLACVETYRSALVDFRTHAEAKSLRPDGQPCDHEHRHCSGLLRAAARDHPKRCTDHIGKEMNELADVEAGIARCEGDLITQYVDPATSQFSQFLVLLRVIPKSWLIEQTRLSKRAVEMIRAGRSIPQARNQQRLLASIRRFARDGGKFTFSAIERLDPAALHGKFRKGQAARAIARR